MINTDEKGKHPSIWIICTAVLALMIFGCSRVSFLSSPTAEPTPTSPPSATPTPSPAPSATPSPSPTASPTWMPPPTETPTVELPATVVLPTVESQASPTPGLTKVRFINGWGSQIRLTCSGPMRRTLLIRPYTDFYTELLPGAYICKVETTLFPTIDQEINVPEGPYLFTWPFGKISP